MVRIFALHDSDPEQKKLGSIEITDLGTEIEQLNEDGFGIYWVINDFDGDRKQENLTKINAWFCDIDDGTKREQMSRIEKLYLPPSLVVETYKGYHCYWLAVNATFKWFKAIEERLIELTKADSHCKDPLRLLRMPYMNHVKDPKNPFFCDVVIDNEKRYTEEQMRAGFKVSRKIKPENKFAPSDKMDFNNPDNWEKFFKISQIKEGCRNAELYRIAKWITDEGYSRTQMRKIINGINNQLPEPLPQNEIDTITR